MTLIVHCVPWWCPSPVAVAAAVTIYHSVGEVWLVLMYCLISEHLSLRQGKAVAVCIARYTSSSTLKNHVVAVSSMIDLITTLTLYRSIVHNCRNKTQRLARQNQGQVVLFAVHLRAHIGGGW